MKDDWYEANVVVTKMWLLKKPAFSVLLPRTGEIANKNASSSIKNFFWDA